jgi:hypothetical protein
MGGVSTLVISFSEKRFEAETMMTKLNLLNVYRCNGARRRRQGCAVEALQIPNAECEHLTVV